jgi:predicted thioredoxin/glutaredoxin
MLRELARLGRTLALPPLEVVDVDSDPLLRRRHGLDVPVLLLDGTVVCRHRLDPTELTRLLRPVPALSAPDGPNFPIIRPPLS